jgi:hypothetical protein
MPCHDKVGIDIESLVQQLYAKKSWLDAVIAGMEAEAESAYKPLSVVVGAISNDIQGPYTDLSSESQSLLLHLASPVRRGAEGGREQNRKTVRRVA